MAHRFTVRKGVTRWVSTQTKPGLHKGSNENYTRFLTNRGVLPGREWGDNLNGNRTGSDDQGLERRNPERARAS